MPKATPALPTRWRRAPSPNIPTRPTRSITRCRRRSSPMCSARTANTPRASTRSRQSTLQEAEEEALRQTVEHADLADGQSILELGCGWGSLSLWMARQFPHAQVTAVSNSHSQREYIEAEAAARGLNNLRGDHRRHERVRPAAAVRPHRVGGDVRAHDELARTADARAVMAGAGRPLLHAHLHPPHRRLSVRPRRPRRTGSRSISSPAA